MTERAPFLGTTGTRAPLLDAKLERAYLQVLIFGEWPAHIASIERLDPEDLFSASHRKLLEHVYAIANRGEQLGELSMRNEIVRAANESGTNPGEQLDSLEKIVGGEVEIGSPALIAKQLSELAVLRRVREKLWQGVAAIDRQHLEAAQEFAREAAADSGEPRISTMSIHDAAVLAIRTARTNPDRSVRMRTGFPLVDAAVRGQPARTMMIIGGRTGAGKSTMALGIAMHAARTGLKTGIISCEDAEDIWAGRALSYTCNLQSDKLLQPQLSLDEASEIDRGLEGLRHVGIELCMALNRPLVDVLAAMRALASRGCKVCVVDYVQAIMLGLARGRVTRAELVSNAAQQIKAQAQALDMQAILCSQLSRPEKQKPFAEPHNGDLKESGDLENMAEIIMLLWSSSDREDKRMLGKISKIKWGPKRPRFEMLLDEQTGALRALGVLREPEEQEQPQQGGGRRWS